MISATTPGCVASQAPRQVRIWSSACGSVGAAGRSARLALRRAHRVDARELNLDRDDTARPAALSRPRRAQAAWDLARAAVEDRDRAISPPGGEGDAGVGGEVRPTDGVLVGAESEQRPGELGVDWGDMRLAAGPTVAIATSRTLRQNSTNSAADIWRAG
jgi:hypothetical protein